MNRRPEGDAALPGALASDPGQRPALPAAVRWSVPRRWIRAGIVALGTPAFAILLAYLAASVVVTGDAWKVPVTRWVGSCCDQEQAMWFLSWVPYAIRHGADPFVTQQLNAPAGVNLMWNASIPLISLLLAPVTLIEGPIFAYNVALVAGITLSAWCGYLVLRRYTNGDVGPFVGGAVFGFSPFVMARAAIHLNLTWVWIVPLFLLVLDEIVVRDRRSPRRLGVALGILAVCQLLVAEELLATSVLTAGILVLLLALHRPRLVPSHLGRLLQALAAATVTFVVIAGWPLYVQFLGPQQIRGRVQDPSIFSTDLLNLVVPTRAQLVAPAAATQLSDHFSGLSHEANGYVGLPLLLVLTAIVARGWGDLRLRLAGLVAGIAFVFSLGPYLHLGGASTGWPLPWWPFTLVPVIENVLPSRFAVFMWLAIAAIVAIAVDGALRLHWRAAAPRGLAIALALVFVVPAIQRSSTAPVPLFFQRWEHEGMRADANVLVAPFFRDGAGADPMLWAAVAGDAVRMPEAYAYAPLPDGRPNFGPPPTQLSSVMETIQDREITVVARGEVRTQIARDLAAARVTDVIVGPMAARDQMLAFFTDLFGTLPTSVDGVEIWRNVDRSGVAPST